MDIFKKNIVFILFLLIISSGFNFSVYSSNGNYSIIPQNSNVSNKQKLDKFLNDILNARVTFKSDSNYIVFINNLDNRLDLLKNKFSSNSQIIEMVSYLKEGVNNIKIITKENSDIDLFFCELNGKCGIKDKVETENIENIEGNNSITGGGHPNTSTGTIDTKLSQIEVVNSYAAYRQGSFHVRYSLNQIVSYRNIILKIYGTSQATYSGNESMFYELNLKNYNNGNTQFLNFNFPNDALLFNIKDTSLFSVTPWIIELYDEDNKKILSKFQLGLLEGPHWKVVKDQISYSGILEKSNTKIISNNFRLTHNKYQGNFLAFGDVCTQEFGSDWTIDYRGEGLGLLFADSKEDIWNNHSRFYQKLDNLRTSYDVYDGVARCGRDGCWYYEQRPAIDFYKVSCKKHNNQELPKVSDSIKITIKGYPAGFGNLGRNVCEEEFGNGWNVSRDEKTFEEINTTQPIWFTGMGAMGGCEDYIGSTRGIHLLNGNISISNCSIGANQQVENFNHRLVCERRNFDLDVLNTKSFREKLTGVSFSELEKFIGNIKNELNSKIIKRDGFIFINNQIAITEKQYSVSEVGNIGLNICPTGYILTPGSGYQRGGLSGMFDKYTLEVLGWYYSQHGNNKPSGSTINPFITYDFLTNNRTLSRIRLSNGYSYWRMPIQGNYYLSSATDTVGINSTSTEKYTVLCQAINRNSITKNYFEPKIKNTYIVQDTNQIAGYTSAGAETYLLYGFQFLKSNQSGTGLNNLGVQEVDDKNFSRMQYYLPVNDISGRYYFYYHDKNN